MQMTVYLHEKKNEENMLRKYQNVHKYSVMRV